MSSRNSRRRSHLKSTFLRVLRQDFWSSLVKSAEITVREKLEWFKGLVVQRDRIRVPKASLLAGKTTKASGERRLATPEGLEMRKLFAGVEIQGLGNADEGMTGQFDVYIPAAETFAITVNYSVSGSASPTLDYTALSGTAVIPAGSTVASILVPSLNDNVLEPSESVQISLTSANAGAYSIGAQSSASILILDKDVGFLRASVVDSVVAEVGDTTGQFRLRIEDNVGNPLTSSTDTTVTFSIGGSATPGSDYSAISLTTVTMLAGQSTALVNVNALNDMVNFDDGETVVLTPTGLTTSHPSFTFVSTPATVTISDPSRAIASVSAVSMTVSEGPATQFAEFMVSLTSPAVGNVTLGLSYSGDAQNAGVDYASGPASVTILSGQSTAVVSLAVVDDSFVEGDETIGISLSYIAGTVAINSLSDDASVIIAKNDASTLTVSGSTVVEGTGTANTTSLTFQLSNPADVPVTFTYGVDGSSNAEAGDYTLSALNVTFAASQTVAYATVTTTPDSTVEGNENLVVSLVSQTGGPAVTLSSGLGTVAIQDDDVAVYSVSAGTVSEGDVGEFTISLSNPAETNTTVTFAVSNGSATAGLDFTAPAVTTAVISAGSQSTVVSLTTTEDSLLEADETLQMSLTGVTGQGSFSLGTSPAVLTIDDDDSVTINVQAPVGSVVELNPTTTTTESFLLVMGQQSSQPTTITLELGSGTADGGGVDFTNSETLTLTMPAFSNLLSVPVGILGDTIVENNETIIAVITGTSNPAITAGTNATISIIDDDSATVSVSAGDMTITEGGYAVFTLSQSALASTDTVITYSFNPGSAIAADVSGASGVATISAGTQTALVSIQAVDDSIVEVQQAFSTSFSLVSGDSSVTFGGATRNVTIADNDSASITITGVTSVAEVSGNATLTYTVAISNPSEVATEVVVDTVDGSASLSTGDYNDAAQTVTIAPNTTAGTFTTFTVVVNDDTNVEANETMLVSLVSVVPNGATVSLDSVDEVTLTITDNDSSTLSISAPASVSEGPASTAVFTLALSAPSSVDTVVRFSTQNGPGPNNAVQGALNDYIAVTQSLTFTAGETSKTVTVTINDDLIDEVDERFRGNLTLVASNGASVVPATVQTSTVTIVDNDDQTIALVGGTTVVEGGNAWVTFNIGPSSTSVTVLYSVSAISSEASDYPVGLPANVTQVFAASTTASSYAFFFPTTDDSLLEPLDTVLVSITSVTGGNSPTIVDNNETLGILDNEVGTVSVSGPSTVGEADGSVSFTISLNTISEVDTFVTYSTVAGSATAGSDYTTVTGTATISAGSSAVTVPVTILNSTQVEDDETFSLSLTGVDGNGASVVASSSPASVTIIDDDTATITVTKIVDGSETIVGPTGNTGRFRLQLSNTVDVDTTVSFSIPGSATEGTDYNTVGTTAVIPAGSLTVNVDIVPMNDTIVEGSETVTLTIVGQTGDSNVTWSATPATLTIQDNDASSLSVSGASVSEGSGTAVLTFSLTNPSATATTVAYSLGGSALDPSDYTDGSAGVVVIPALSLTATTTLSITENAIVEGTETTTLTVTGITGAVSGLGATSTVTITDNDSAVVKIVPVATSINESADAQFLVFLDTVSASDTTVAISYSGLSASDYDSVPPASVVIPAGSLSTLVTVAINDDTLVESSETLAVALGAITGTGSIALGSPSTASVTVHDNDTASVTIQASATVNENVGFAVVNVTLSNPSDSATVVSFTTVNGTASTTLDYTGATSAVTFTAGQTVASISVAIENDAIVEADETFSVSLTSVSGDP